MEKVTREYTCDGCGKTYKSNSNALSSVFSPDRPNGLNRLNLLKRHFNGGIEFVDYDFCDSCSKKVVKFLDDFTKKDE